MKNQQRTKSKKVPRTNVHLGLSQGGRGDQKDPPVRRVDTQEQILPGISLFGLKVLKRRLRYSDSISLTSSTGVAGGYVFSANGLFDPDITSTGHQPVGFDQMMVSFNHYCVKRSKIIATFINTGTHCSIAVKIAGSPTLVTIPNQIVEDGRVVRDHLNDGKIGDNYIKTLEIVCDIGRSTGVGNIRDEFDLRGSAAANPVEQEYFHVQSWGLSSTSLEVDVVVEYEAWFTEPRDLTESLRKLKDYDAAVYKSFQDDKRERNSQCAFPPTKGSHLSYMIAEEGNSYLSPVQQRKSEDQSYMMVPRPLRSKDGIG